MRDLRCYPPPRHLQHKEPIEVSHQHQCPALSDRIVGSLAALGWSQEGSSRFFINYWNLFEGSWKWWLRIIEKRTVTVCIGCAFGHWRHSCTTTNVPIRQTKPKVGVLIQISKYFRIHLIAAKDFCLLVLAVFACIGNHFSEWLFCVKTVEFLSFGYA